MERSLEQTSVQREVLKAHFGPGLGEALVKGLEAAEAEARGERLVAVFDADGTLWADDLGEDLFRWLIQERRLLGVDYGEDLYGAYEARCAEDQVAGYASLGPIMKGLAVQDVEAWADAFFEAEYKARIFPAQRALVEVLHARGWEAWAVSASVRIGVRVGVARLGIPAERVLGIDVEVEDGRLSDRLVRPVTAGEGKVQAIDAWIGVRPWLASGNSMGDAPMLEASRGVRLCVNPGAALASEARAGVGGGWLVASLRASGLH